MGCLSVTGRSVAISGDEPLVAHSHEWCVTVTAWCPKRVESGHSANYPPLASIEQQLWYVAGEALREATEASSLKRSGFGDTFFGPLLHLRFLAARSASLSYSSAASSSVWRMLQSVALFASARQRCACPR